MKNWSGWKQQRHLLIEINTTWPSRYILLKHHKSSAWNFTIRQVIWPSDCFASINTFIYCVVVVIEAIVGGTEIEQKLFPRSVGRVIVEHTQRIKHGWECAASVGVSDRSRGCCRRYTGWQTTGAIILQK